MIFYLGTHEPAWLWSRSIGVPLFVSCRRLARRPRRSPFPGALAQWALDSGGFSELSMFGAWRTSPSQYAAEARRWRDEIGRLDWAAVQDWMCEPSIRARTGLTVREHQERTVESYLVLVALAPDIPWAPVLQGWNVEDYHAHVEMHSRAGVDLWAAPAVGVGSVCRRQHTAEVEGLIRELAAAGLEVHGFGFKVEGVARCANALASADSLAWSLAARRRPPLPGCSHETCANCPRFALAWRARVLESLRGPHLTG